MGRLVTAKRVVTILWSVGLAAVLIALSAAVMLPSTKRARISFEEREEMMRSAEARAAAATKPATSKHIPGSKSNNFDLDSARVLYATPATQPTENWFGESPAVSSSKFGVFDIDKARVRLDQSTQPTVEVTRDPAPAFHGSKSGVFDLDAARRSKFDPTTVPATSPASP